MHGRLLLIGLLLFVSEHVFCNVVPEIDSFVTNYLSAEIKDRRMYIKTDSAVFVTMRNYGCRNILKVRELPHGNALKRGTLIEVASFKKQTLGNSVTYLFQVTVTAKRANETILTYEESLQFIIVETKGQLNFYLTGGLSDKFLGKIIKGQSKKTQKKSVP